MKERPINMRAEEVRAILAGRKTQFRRVINWPLLSKSDGTKQRMLIEADAPLLVEILKENTKRHPHLQFRQLGAPGDRLWVRECWAPHADMPRAAIYRCDPGGDYQDNSDGFRWRSSIHMPRWASRITLEIVSVRVERLQNISRADAKAEGLWPSPHNGLEMVNGVPYGNAQLAFRALWESIHGPRLWEANPWVWVVEFRRLEGAQ